MDGYTKTDAHNEQEADRGARLHSSVVTLQVQADEKGRPRIVLEGIYMTATGFKPGDVVEAVVQPELISILRAE